jgi:16S rRNA (cytidine1402-2'-O)-methyltransferase
MSKLKGRLFLLPSPIDEQGMASIPPEAIRILHSLDYFIVERARTSRRYISQTRPARPIDILHIEEIPENMTDQKFIDAQLAPLLEGHNMGLLSEAGLPAIADPGNVYVATAHRLGIPVVPVSGPSSLMMALMASGLEGQRFAFHGYLTAKKDDLGDQLRGLERRADRDDATQIWIEAPYRNRQMLDMAGQVLDAKRMFCIAAGLGGKDGFVLTRNIVSWKRSGWPEIHKIPAVFLMK